MNNQKFKTNINCGSCVNAVTPTLNELVGANNWSVDIAVESKTLSVDSDEVMVDIIIEKLSSIGFNAEAIK